VLGSTDDVINVAGHRLSTGVIEAVVAAHQDVAECAVIGVADDLKGQAPRAFVVLKAGSDISAADLSAQIVSEVRQRVGPVAAMKDVVVVPGLPKTRSGKIMRRLLRDVAEGRELGDTTTLADPGVVDEIRSRAEAVPTDD